MSRIRFEDTRPAAQVDPGRVDVACFVGLVRRVGMAIPAGVRSWLQPQGLLRFPFTPAPGLPAPTLPADVRAWFLSQGWIQGSVSSAAVPNGTLAAAIGSADTSISVVPALALSSTTIAIDTEVLTVVSIDATSGNLKVTRGPGGTAAPHALGAPVFVNVIGTLATAIPADAQTIVLAAALIADPPLFARVGTEIVAVAQVDPSGTLLTVTRGVGRTAAVSHAQGDPIVSVALDPLAQLALQLTNAIPAALQTWLRSAGWLTGRMARDLDQLYDVPLPVENYAGFMTLFDPGDSSQSAGTDYVAAAVRSFFAQGGQRCYVVRMGDPVAVTDQRGDLAAKLAALLVEGSHQASDPSSWHGAGHLAGLSDVSFLALPDLPILSASAPPSGAEVSPDPVLEAVQFAECSQDEPGAAQYRVFSGSAPRLALSDFAGWAASVANILQFLVSGTLRQELHLREVQFVAALPLPQDLAFSGTPAVDSSAAALARDVHTVIAAFMPEDVAPSDGITSQNISSAFLQLAYPWLKTTGSIVLTESLEPPDGALVGILARNALKSGTFASATKVVPADISDLWPSLPARDTNVSATPLIWDNTTQKALIERISLFGFTPRGVRLLSDVTAYPGEAYRSASINRLVSVICRAARRFGETIVFGSNGPALWGRVRAYMQNVMTQLWSANALDGATVKDAFTVRCDASTMTQNDLDQGRLIANLTFAPAAKIELIRVTLGFEAGATSTQQIATALAQAV